MSFKIYKDSVWSNQKSLKIFYNTQWKSAVKGWVFKDSQWKLAYPEYPIATVNPTITATSGTIGVVGSTYTVSNGTWQTGDAYLPNSYSYQWKRSGNDISGATGQTYTTVSADVDNIISVTVTAINQRGSTPITISTGVYEYPKLSSASVYDFTYTPSAPGSVSISTSSGAYSGSFTAGSLATSYQGTTTNGSVNVNSGSLTYSGTGTGGSVQVGIRSVNAAHQVLMSWNHVPGAASYDIWVGTFGLGSPWKNVSAAGKNVGDNFTEIYTGADTNSTYYTIVPKTPSGLQGTAVQYLVSTSDKYSAYTYSATDTIPSLTDFTYNIIGSTAIPSQPSISALSFSSNQVSYSWSSTDATSWQSSISGGPEGYRSNSRSVASDYWSATPGNSYSVSVYGVNSSTRATLYWGSSTGATSYTVYYTVDGSSGSQSTTGTSIILYGTNISINGVTAYDATSAKLGTPGTTTSVSLSATTGNTGTQSGTYPAPAPLAPGAPTVIGTSTSSVSVSWSSVANATSYDLFWNYSTSGPGAPDYTGLGTSKSLTGLSSGSNIYVWVRAVGPGGTSAWSSYGVGATNSAGSAPGAPSLSNSYSFASPYNTWTLTISPNGGTAPVTYYWSIMFSNSSGGATLASATGSTTGTSVTRNSSTYNWARWSVYASNAYGTSSTVYSNWA